MAGVEPLSKKTYRWARNSGSSNAHTGLYADLSSAKGKPLKEMTSLVANAMYTPGQQMRLPQRRLRYRR
eukprot:scaffold11153_cov84-Skeletonema_dohrnii-CCMP3373.AAC.2